MSLLSNMQTLTEIYERHKVPDNQGHGDKGTVHSYIPVYEDLLAPYRQRCSFMEIGLAYGKSVAMWDDYFGLYCELAGVDLNLRFDTSEFPDWHFIEGNILDVELPDDWLFDVVIDDGSHLLREQVATWKRLQPRMNPGGIYIIEDVPNPREAAKSFPGCEVMDFRHLKNRHDDALLVIRT